MAETQQSAGGLNVLPAMKVMQRLWQQDWSFWRNKNPLFGCPGCPDRIKPEDNAVLFELREQLELLTEVKTQDWLTEPKFERSSYTTKLNRQLVTRFCQETGIKARSYEGYSIRFTEALETCNLLLSSLVNRESNFPELMGISSEFVSVSNGSADKCLNQILRALRPDNDFRTIWQILRKIYLLNLTLRLIAQNCRCLETKFDEFLSELISRFKIDEAEMCMKRFHFALQEDEAGQIVGRQQIEWAKVQNLQHNERIVHYEMLPLEDDEGGVHWCLLQTRKKSLLSCLKKLVLKGKSNTDVLGDRFGIMAGFCNTADAKWWIEQCNAAVSKMKATATPGRNTFASKLAKRGLDDIVSERLVVRTKDGLSVEISTQTIDEVLIYDWDSVLGHETYKQRQAEQLIGILFLDGERLLTYHRHWQQGTV